MTNPNPWHEDEKREHRHDAHGQDAHRAHKPHKGGGPGHAGAHEEHEGAPEWLISFADNVMLMMGIFVILLALNMNKAATAGAGESPGEGAPAGVSAEELDFALAVREAFNNPVSVHSDNPAEARLVRRLREKFAQRGAGEPPAPGDVRDTPQTRPLGPSERAWQGHVLLFKEFSTECTPDMLERVAEMAPEYAGTTFAVEIRGHASVWEGKNHPERSYEIAYNRALAVAKALVENGVPWERIRIQSFGDSATRSTLQLPDQSSDDSTRVEIMLVK